MKRVISVLSAGLLAMFGVFATGGAASAYPSGIGLAVSVVGCADVLDGADVQVVNVKPGSSVTIAWEQTPKPKKSTSGSVTVIAGQSGIASAVLPIQKARDYVITATTTVPAPGESATATVTVVKSCDDEGIGGDEDANSDNGATGGSTDTTGSTGGSETVTGGLADTGSDAGLLLALAAGALLMGGTTVVVARSRRWSDADKS